MSVENEHMSDLVTVTEKYLYMEEEPYEGNTYACIDIV